MHDLPAFSQEIAPTLVASGRDHRCAPHGPAANNPFRMISLRMARPQSPWNHILTRNRGRGGATPKPNPSPRLIADRSIGTSVLAAVGPLSGTDMPLLPANRGLNMNSTRELRVQGFGLVAAPKVD